MRNQLLSSVYGIFQYNLEEHDMLDRYGAPKKRKDISIHTKDIIDVYKWLSEQLKDVSEYQLNENTKVFNKHAKQLHDDYLLNMTLLGAYLLLNYINEYGSKPEQIMIASKLERITSHFSYHVERDVYKESRIAADNLLRKFAGKPELTIEVRSKNAKRWKEKSRNKYGQVS